MSNSSGLTTTDLLSALKSTQAKKATLWNPGAPADDLRPGGIGSTYESNTPAANKAIQGSENWMSRALAQYMSTPQASDPMKYGRWNWNANTMALDPLGAGGGGAGGSGTVYNNPVGGQRDQPHPDATPRISTPSQGSGPLTSGVSGAPGQIPLPNARTSTPIGGGLTTINIPRSYSPTGDLDGGSGLTGGVTTPGRASALGIRTGDPSGGGLTINTPPSQSINAVPPPGAIGAGNYTDDQMRLAGLYQGGLGAAGSEDRWNSLSASVGGNRGDIQSLLASYGNPYTGQGYMANMPQGKFLQSLGIVNADGTPGANYAAYMRGDMVNALNAASAAQGK